MNFGAGGTSGGLYSFGGLSNSSLSIDTTSNSQHQITSSTGNIDFTNENLSTSGSINCGNLTTSTGSITSSTGAISFSNENLSTSGYFTSRGISNGISLTNAGTYKHYNYIGGYNNIFNTYQQGSISLYNLVHGVNIHMSSTGAYIPMLGKNGNSQTTTTLPPDGHYIQNSAIFGSNHYLNTGTTYTNNATGASIGYGFQTGGKIGDCVIAGNYHSIAQTRSSAIFGTSHVISIVNPYHLAILNEQASPNTPIMSSQYSIVAGYNHGYISPCILWYCAIFGRNHCFSEKSESYRAPFNTGMYLPRRTNYALASGYNHTFKHDYCTLLGSSQTTTGHYQLRNSGSIYANGGLVNSSDRRIKKDIVDADPDESYNIISQLKVRKYKYTDNYRKSLGGILTDDTVMGCIAQEVEQIYPECVKTEEKELYEPAIDDPTGTEEDPTPPTPPVLLESFDDFKVIDKQKLIWPMIQTIQVLMQKVESLENELILSKQ